MALLNIKNVNLGFGGPLLLEQINLQIHQSERVCLLGRNGTGKSTLIKLISGQINPDSGEVIIQQGAKIAQLNQEVPQVLKGTIFDVVLKGLNSTNQKIQEDWHKHQQVETILSRMNINPDNRFETLSAGLKRRIMLAQALVSEPDILLLDEPTNHLDINSIKWLEEFLLRYVKTILFVTHDRMFLRNLATRIIELDRGSLNSWACDYDTFLERKQSALDAEANQQLQFDKKLAKEEAWIRQGIKARRTRNEGRVRALKKMREQYHARRKNLGSVKMLAQEARRTGKLVMEATNITYMYEDKPVIKNFSTTIMRGDKVGIIGPNGCGKTTLLNLLLGNRTADKGQIRHGTHIEASYFDQLRMQLDEQKTVQENVGEGNDTVLINEKPRHIIGYLQDFLFSPQRARSPVSMLSGGERNRLLLAKIFTKPSNVLILDEPTNDLDAETLELLEELLMSYKGTLLLVSHDREFLNNVVTSTLAFEGNGNVREYVGGYDDWAAQCCLEPSAKKEKNHKKVQKTKPKKENKKKLSYKEQRELDALPQLIEDLEDEQTKLHEMMSDPDFYQKAGQEIAKTKNRLDKLEQELELKYQRWEELEAVNEKQ